MANPTTEPSTTAAAETGAESTASNPLSFDIPSSSGLFGSDVTLNVAPDTGASLTGGDGADVLVGGAGADSLDGGSGQDVLIGGAGSNILHGGEGDDTFGHAAGANDTITDFAPSQGEQVFAAQGLTVSDTQATTMNLDLGSGATDYQASLVTFSDGSTVTLVGVDTATASSSDWLVTA